MADPSISSAAAEALRIATVDPERALALAVDCEVRARGESDWVTRSVALRAAGVAEMQRRNLETATALLKGAVAAGRHAHADRLVGEARMSLASALVLRGAPTRAFSCIDAALRDLGGIAAARARVQRAAILQELGRIDDAFDDLRVALPVLRRANDIQWETRALSNRSLLHSARRHFAAAENDLLRAARLCDEHDLVLSGAYVEQNLGCVLAGRGDVPAALEHFASAQQRYDSLGLRVGSLFVDRATLLLSVRLVDEARAQAEAAVRAFEEQRRNVHVPEARLLLSTIALLQNDTDTALAAATEAQSAFARLRREEWLALARWAHFQAVMAVPGRRVSPTRARRCAEDLERAGWRVPALEARILAGRLALARGHRTQALVDLSHASRARFSGPADARAKAWYAEALVRSSDGRRRSAASALRAGLRVLDDYRATFGATELRAHVSIHRGALARLGLRMAIEDGDAHKVQWWAERTLASRTLVRPVRPPDDALLAEALEDLRATMTEIERRRSEGASTRLLVQRQVMLEQQIRDHCRRSRGAGRSIATGPSSSDQIAAELGASALVEFVDLDSSVYAVTVVDGRVALHFLGPAEPVRHQLAHLPFALHRLARPSTHPAQISAASTVLEHSGRVFDSALLGPIAHTIGERDLVVVPTPWLQPLPWSTLPSCAGRAVTVAPSADLWLSAHKRVPPSGAGVVVIAGPGLPGAQEEAAAVASLYPGARSLAGSAARATAAGRAMTGAMSAHIAAHGRVRSDNPLFSSFLLDDGPFTVYDLERLASTPFHVVLAACDTARSHVLEGGEVLGLSAALLGLQTSTLIAPVVPIPDLETAPMMLAYHRHLIAGQPPAAALALAQGEVAQDGPLSRAAAASFICLGDGMRILPSFLRAAEATPERELDAAGVSRRASRTP